MEHGEHLGHPGERLLRAARPFRTRRVDAAHRRGRKNSAYEIIAKKKATYYGIAMSVKRICEAIVRDEKPILPVSNFQNGVHGLHEWC